MKKANRFLAILLSVLLACSLGTQAFAADEVGKPYSPVVGVIDKALGAMHDGVFAAAQGIMQVVYRQFRFPTYSEFLAEEHPYYYKGTDGVTRGNGWRGGYASGSIIPVEWRRDAAGNPDPNGMCLDKMHPTGGYQWKLNKIYTDQMANVMILSNGSDGNGNGVPDVLLFICIDGVGVAGGTVKKIRAAVAEALAPAGVTAQDILGCNISASHCHVALDTQGMNTMDMFLNGLKNGRSLNETMENTIVKQAAASAKAAYDKMENGSLSFFETDPVSGAEDKMDSGERTKNYFSCFLFEGESGEKTILANIGAHPTKYFNGHALFADYPYLTRVAMNDAGYNFLFCQSAQANVNGPGLDVDENSARSADADAWAATYALTKEDWTERYGKAYAERYYEKSNKISEREFNGERRKGYLFAHYILDAAAKAKAIAPTLEVRNAQTPIRLEYGLMALACATGLLGENTVRDRDAEAGYAIVVETNYIALGDDVVILTAPGELAPSLLLGTNPDYTGDSLWTGVTSWTGEDWPYDTLESIVRQATGDPDKAVLLFGITNDAMAYIYPDVDVPQAFLSTLFYKEGGKHNRADMMNCMLMTMGAKTASQLMDSYIRVIENK
ncbi:MAG: hypothetical protein IJT44_03135 [Clostridia bacterium]|nr:hypothetical protein [Clostridia bacterium]